jgi:CheY-like chemotaxis protein
MTALIIEDERDMADRIADMMEPLASHRYKAYSLSEGITRLTSGEAYDIITLDLGLPPHGREETIAAIPTVRRLAPLALIIIITGLSMPDTAKLCVDAGADALFEKTEVSTSCSFMQKMESIVLSLLKHAGSKDSRTKILQAITANIADYCTP